MELKINNLAPPKHRHSLSGSPLANSLTELHILGANHCETPPPPQVCQSCQVTTPNLLDKCEVMQILRNLLTCKAPAY